MVRKQTLLTAAVPALSLNDSIRHSSQPTGTGYSWYSPASLSLSRRMRVLVLAPHPFYQDRGTPIDVSLLVTALSNRGESVDLVTYHEGQDWSYPNVTLHRIWAPRVLRGIRPGFSLAKVLCDLLLFVKAWRLVHRHKYDVIHAGEEAVFFAMFFNWIYRLPYVYDMDSSLAQQMVEQLPWLRPLAWVLNGIEARAIRRGIAVAPVCSALADVAKAHGASTVVTLHDISQLQDSDFEPDWTLRKRLEIDGILAMYVGNLEKYQGIELMLDSFALARREGTNMDLVIAGGHPASIDYYRRRAAKLGVAGSVHFIGPWPSAELGRLLAGADFLVAPRIRGVNTPMKIFPYLHSGRPVLATKLPTHTQLLDDSVALLAPAEPAGMAQAMIRLAQDEYLRRTLGAAGKRFVQTNHLPIHYKARVNRLYDLVGDLCTRVRYVPT